MKISLIIPKSVLVAVGFAVVIFGLYLAFGVPFVSIEERKEWAVGIVTGTSPIAFGELPAEPILTSQDVTDITAEFVADPFLFEEDGTWYLFVEVLNLENNQGDISVATSTDGLHYEYRQVVLDEPFHLSYPIVFKWQDEYWMVPDTFEANHVSLYRAVDFPWRWEHVARMLEGLHVDSTPFHHDGRWWLFTTPTEQDNFTRLYFADELAGPYTEHPESPVVEFDANFGRSGGNVVSHEGRLFRYVQDDYPSYGNQLYAFEITRLTPTEFAQELVNDGPLLTPAKEGWTAKGIHTLSPVQVNDQLWIGAMDGKSWVKRYHFAWD